MNFKLRQLEGFVSAARHVSFSHAARELAMTQPAFSQLIRELERALGVRLFERTTRRVALTEAGQRLLDMVERPLHQLKEVDVVMREVAAGRQGRVEFAALPCVASGFATQALAEFRKRHPAVTVRLMEEQNLNVVQKVSDREVDFGIGTLSTACPNLRFAPLLHDELVAILPDRHPLSARKTLSWSELAAEPLVLLPSRSSVRELAEAGFSANGLELEPAYEVMDMITALGFVRAGLALTIMPRLALAELNTVGLCTARLCHPTPRRIIGVITHAGRALPPAGRACVDLLFAQVKGQSELAAIAPQRHKVPATDRH